MLFRSVSIRDKGSSLLKYYLGVTPTLNIKFNDYVDGDNLRISALELRTLISDAFGNNVSILSLSSDSLRVPYTTLPAKRVPVKIDGVVEPNFQYVISGNITISQDSVDIYSDKSTLDKIKEVNTYNFEEKDLKDTLNRSIKILPIKGVRIRPEKIDMMRSEERRVGKEC